MKLLFAIFLVVVSSSVNAQSVKYFDEKGIEFSKKEYQSKAKSKDLLEVSENSFTKRLSVREEIGQVSDINLLYKTVSDISGQKVDTTKPLVIIYYPGKDNCNSSGSSNKDWTRNWYSDLENGIKKVVDVKPYYISKDNKGLKGTEGIVDWKKDNGTIETQFFKYHYPCCSFVVIAPDGRYMSYFGEFPKEYVWEATRRMSK